MPFGVFAICLTSAKKSDISAPSLLLPSRHTALAATRACWNVTFAALDWKALVATDVPGSVYQLELPGGGFLGCAPYHHLPLPSHTLFPCTTHPPATSHI